jgi:HAE1 family hydrophobic/amphiphilic exporter-1
VDDSIVVIENMFRHLEMGKNKRKAALDGAKQIVFTCLAITTVICVVFLPLTVVGGIIGSVLVEFAVPIMVATAFSLFVSFTVSPLLMSRFGKLSQHKERKSLADRFSVFFEAGFDALQSLYVSVLKAGLNRKLIVACLTIVLLIASFALIPAGFIGFEFMPQSDQGEFMVTLDLNPQVTTYQNNQITMRAESIISQRPEVSTIYTNVGASGYGALQVSALNNRSIINVKLIDKKERTKSVHDIAEEVKNEIMKQIPGVRATAAATSMAGNQGAPIQYIVQGANFDEVETTAYRLLDIMRKIPGATDVKFSTDDPKQEVQISVDREKIAKLQLNIAEVGATLRTFINGNNDAKYSDGNYEYDIRIAVDNFDRTRLEDVAKLTFLNRRGQLIELDQFADIRYGIGPAALTRTNRISSITLQSNVIGRPTGTVGAEMKAAFVNIPPGVQVVESGMLEQQAETFGSLGYAFLAAIIMIYFIMIILYDSLLDPLIVLFSIPLSLIGAFLILALTMNNLTIFSIIGLIVLIGLVSKNAILLVDFANHMRRDKDMDIYNALVEAGKERLRPILMTTFALIFGMLPIALATGDGAEIKNGMAWVIIGGLISSMLLTLVVVPVVYYTFHKLIERWEKHNRNRLIHKAKERMIGHDLNINPGAKYFR